MSIFATPTAAHERANKSGARSHIGTRSPVGGQPQQYGIEGCKASAARVSQSSLSGERCVSLLIAPQNSRWLDLLKSFGSSNRSDVKPGYELPLWHVVTLAAALTRKAFSCASISWADRHEYRCGSLLRLSGQTNVPSTRCYFMGKRARIASCARLMCARTRKAARKVPRLERLYDVVVSVCSALGKLPVHV